MNDTSLLSRRKFGQFFLISSVATLTGVPLVNAANKAGSSDHFIYGIDGIAGSRRLQLKRLNLRTRKVETVLDPIPDVFVELDELITTFARLDNTSFAIATAPTNYEGKSSTPTLITFELMSSKVSGPAKNSLIARSGAKPKKAAVTQLKGGNKIDGIVKNPQGKLITLTSLASTRQILSFDSDLQKSGDVLIPNSRFAPAIKNLSPSTQGKVYGVSVEGHGHHAMSTTLWMLNPQQRTLGFQKIKMLTLNGEIWANGFRSIVSTPDGKLYGLGAPADLDRNQIYEIHPKSGKMKRIVAFDVINIAA